MSNKKLTKVVTSLALVASMSMTMIPAYAATSATATIDTNKTGSITLHKYDITSAQKGGVDTSQFKNDGTTDTKAETDLKKYALPGVIFSYLKVADVYTETKTTSSGVSVKTLYGFTDTNLVGDLGLDVANAELTKNNTYYYTSTEINDSLKAKLENANAGTKNTLESYIKSNGGTDMPETSSTGLSSVNNLPVGLYMVVETYVPNDVSYTTDPFLVSIPSTTADGQNWMYDINIYPKNQTDYPTLNKKVADDDDYSTAGNNGHALNDSATISEGDIADYRITSKLPIISSKTSYLTKYTFVDTLSSKGLVYNKDSVELYWYDDKDEAEKNNTDNAIAKWAQKDNKFTVNVNENEMTVEMTAKGLDEINPNYSGKYVVVAYNVIVKSTDNLILGDSGNPNNVVLKYSKTNTKYEDTLKDEAIVYSYGIDLTKTFSDNGGDATKVQFKVKNTSRTIDDKTSEYYVVADKVSNGNYHVTGETTNEDDATIFSPGSDGKFYINGLEANTYALTEVATDSGYSLLKDDIIVEITKTNSTITPSTVTIRGQENANSDVIYTVNATASAKVDSNDATMTTKNNSDNALVKVSVENNKKFLVPPTGRLGTFLISLAGFALIALGIICRGKKKAEK